MMMVDAGAPFRIKLDSGPGTDGLWEPLPLPHGVRLLATYFSPKPFVPTTSGSTQEFEIVADQPGRLQLAFALTKRWDPNPIDHRLIDVDVR